MSTCKVHYRQVHPDGFTQTRLCRLPLRVPLWERYPGVSTTEVAGVTCVPCLRLLARQGKTTVEAVRQQAEGAP